MSNSRDNGLNFVGIQPSTYTLYTYSWQVQTQQLLAVGKLLTTFEGSVANHHPFYPYLSVGLGAAFNNAQKFSAITHEIGSINLTPTFGNHTRTSWTYSLGVGVDTPLSDHCRIGLGYRFSDFGNASLDSGSIVFKKLNVPTGFPLSTPHIYANQFIAQISYVA